MSVSVSDCFLGACLTSARCVIGFVFGSYIAMGAMWPAAKTTKIIDTVSQDSLPPYSPPFY